MAQRTAIELLIAGKTDDQVAAVLQCDRVTVCRWRCYDPVFQSHLNSRHADVWGGIGNRARHLLTKALDVYEAALTDEANPNRLRIAGDILKLFPIADAVKPGPTDPEDIVFKIARHRRARAHSVADDEISQEKHLPNFDDHVDQVWQELDAKAEGADGVTMPPSPPNPQPNSPGD